ncbi:MAG TPA: hypothetical protein VNP20_05765 [Nocardioidaceae bacterium]|nr:hypothetical protein [Nocardioidaceae bacterium]
MAHVGTRRPPCLTTKRTPPPEDADNNLRYMWSQPWFLWTLQASGVD